MAFAVDDFRELLRLLEEHPEWRAELRRYVLTDALLELPALVRQLAEAQMRTEQRVDRLEAALVALTARVDALAEAQTRTEHRLAELAQAQGRSEQRLGTLTGQMLELLYRQRAPAYFSRLARRLQVLETGRLADLLDDGVLTGQLSEAEREDVLRADLVLSGWRREDQAEVYILAEVSAVVDGEDVRRAAERAAALTKLGRPVVAVVAGERIDPEAAALARARGVWQVLDGLASSPVQG